MKQDYKEYDNTVQGYMKDIVQELESSGKMKETDRISLDILACNLQKWRMAESEVAKMGILLPSDRGNMSKNPAIDVANAALRQAMAIMQDYGLTALSRKKLKKGEEKEVGNSPLAEFLEENMEKS